MNVIKEGSIASFYTVNKAPIKHLRVYFSLKQEGSGDPSPNNVRPISGWDGVEVTASGKNLFDKNNEDQILNAWLNGNRISGSSVDTTIWIKCRPNTTYTISKIGGVMRVGYSAVAPDYNLNLIDSVRHDNIPSMTITTDATAQYLVAWVCDLSKSIDSSLGRDSILNSLQIEYGDTSTKYEQFKAGRPIFIDWSSSVGSVYGGYVDLITGELVETWHRIVADGVNIKCNSSYMTDEIIAAGIVYLNPVGMSASNRHPNVLMNIVPVYTQVYEGAHFEDLRLPYATCTTAGYQYVVFKIANRSDYPEVSDKTSCISFVNAWLHEHPTTIVYELRTPIVHQLSPTQLSTFIGSNYIWSNADRVEVEYNLSESNDEMYRRRNVLLRSAPHIETVTGSLANFKTDLSAPVKSCKVHFTPVQEGEGNPSLDNVRPINGWCGIETFYANQNLFDPYTIVLSDGTVGMGNYPISFSYNDSISIGYAPSGTLNQMHFWFKQWLVAGIEYRVSYGQVTAILDNGNESAQSIWTFDWFDETMTKRMSNASTFTPLQSGYYYLKIGTYPVGKVYELRIKNIKIQIGNNLTNVDAEPNNTKAVINWVEKEGNIYGGYIDLTTGELVKEWHSFLMDGDNYYVDRAATYDDVNDIAFAYSYIGDGRYFGLSSLPAAMPLSSGQVLEDGYMIKCDKLTVGTNNKIECVQVAAGSQYIRLCLKASRLSDVSSSNAIIQSIKEWLRNNPLQILYRLNTPQIVAKLSPIQLRTLKGTNNIWSNANGPVEVSYWTH